MRGLYTPARFLWVTFVLAFLACSLLLMATDSAGQEPPLICTPDKSACTLPPITIERAEPVIYEPEVVG